MPSPPVMPGPLDSLLGTGAVGCRVIAPDVKIHGYPAEAAEGDPCLCGADTKAADPIECANGCVFDTAEDLETRWWEMVLDACKANGEDPARVGRAQAHDIFQCPTCHAMIPAHER